MKTKLLLFILFLSLTSSNLFAQIQQPVKWKYSIERAKDKEATLIFEANIDTKWHLYGQFFDDGGPVKLVFSFKENTAFQRIGKVIESPAPHKEKDAVFGINVQYFLEKATFKQKIKILTEKEFKIEGNLEGQACSDNGTCVLVSDDFSFQLDKAKEKKDEVTKVITDTSNIQSTDTKPVTTTITPQNTVSTPTFTKINNENLLQDKSLLSLFWLAFLAGLVALLTPCVFPMIPMTVSFFMNKSKARFQALFFGFSIILIYTIIGTIVAIAFGANFANFLSTHWLPNVLFFVIFMIFAASFLGMFEIVLPSSWINKADKQVDKGGIFAPFFMAFTLVVVSFSCTGPLVGTVLVKSAGGAILEPIIAMFGFSLAFALPFTLFAFFPSWLENLPKSGGWLNSVKVVLGFIELALGLKFLSIADQTYHWHILDREIYLAFWIIIFTLMGFYLLGKLKFSHDSDLNYISVPRLLVAIITFTFVVYMIPGMFGASLKALSGYLPPQTSQDFDLQAIIRENNPHSNTLCETPKYGDKLHLPHSLEGYFDYEQGLACAKKLNKPIFIDFTGHGCVNCREMENRVWSNPKVLQRLRENFVLVALYVDDKTELPENERVKSKIDGKLKTSIGKKFADFQISRFNINAQPYYVLLDKNGELLVQPSAYNLNVDDFVKFLDAGISEFNKRK